MTTLSPSRYEESPGFGPHKAGQPTGGRVGYHADSNSVFPVSMLGSRGFISQVALQEPRSVAWICPRWHTGINSSARPSFGWEWAGVLFVPRSITSPMTAQLKPPRTIPQHIETLRSRGTSVDDDLATQWLTHVSYYRLSSYWYPARHIDGSGHRDDIFIDGTSFTDAVHLYEADWKLRTLVFDGMGAYRSGHAYPPHRSALRTICPGTTWPQQVTALLNSAFLPNPLVEPDSLGIPTNGNTTL